MHILVLSLNHKTAPIHIREKMAFQDEELPRALSVLRHTKSILECVIVSTCNRTEVYVVSDQLHTGRYYTKAFLADWFSLDKEMFTPYLTIRENEACIEHLFRVTCGLDSMVLGETQILGQVRDYFMLAQDEGTTGTIFNELFKQAVTLAKKAHYETGIDESAVSVSYAAVHLAKTIFGNLKNKKVLIVGAGETGELTAKNLRGNGVKQITVMNRTFERAQRLAKQLKGQAMSFHELQKAMTDCDIIISSTGSKEYVVTNSIVQPALKKRKGRPLFMIDIAVPRDLDPEIDKNESVFLYNIDDLKHIVEENLKERKKVAEKIELMVEEAVVEFQSWLNTLGVVPMISALRTKALAIQSETMASIERKLPDLSEREIKVLRKHTKSIVNQLLRDPILGLKEMAAEPKAEEAMEMFVRIFAIQEEVEKEKEKQQVQFEKKNETTEKKKLASVGTLKELPLRP
ncbi:glutamyl-tRNA reductase [Pueribacillus theae]|uniref:Glutamyl-tRNA reductase n=1 Tax=Pueribacillus theae TaxID=2171751 RepID=A0A2U1JMM8_9BACI|nr:glutamyl-tRNA reductase [Pueribacillus theae]PWA06392.1 glutamyl-tRNA reductase [Pueribacillus theae]